MNGKVVWTCLLVAGLAIACGHSTLRYTVADGDGDTDVDADADVDGDADCDPPCRWEECQECVYGHCQYYCNWDEWCEWGECVWDYRECDPPCDWRRCEECWDGRCEYYCEGMECDGSGGCIDEVDCDPVADRGCRDGERCAFFSRDGGRWEWGCLPTEADDPGPGEPCVYTTGDPYYGMFDNCRGGSWCMGTTADELTCMRLCTDVDGSYCTGAYPDPEGGFRDGICTLGLAELRGSGILGCIETVGCDPTCDQPCDDSDSACLPVQDRSGNHGTICIGMSRDTPGGFTGDACEYANGCQPGHICMGDGVCHAFCDLEAACPDGEEPPCEFTCCGIHPGETGDEICIAMPDTEDTWQALEPPLGVCGMP